MTDEGGGVPAMVADGGWCWARVRRLRDRKYSFSRSFSSRMSTCRGTAVDGQVSRLLPPT